MVPTCSKAMTSCTFIKSSSTKSSRLFVPTVTLWNENKVYLKNFLSQYCQRVCLTIDTWTSPQNQSYMCLTVQFINNDWNLHKKILNFCQVISNTGEAMAKFVESCLHEWGLSCVLTLTVDNATSNDT